MKDALLLAKVLSNPRSPPDLPNAIAEYHDQVTERGSDAVKKSRNANRYDGERKVHMFAWGQPAVPLPLEKIILSEHLRI